MRTAVLRISIAAALALASSSIARAQSYSCGSATAPGDPTLSPASYSCDSNQTATYNTYCYGSPIFGGASWSSGSGSIYATTSGDCLWSTCPPSFGVGGSGSTLTAYGYMSVSSLLGGVPICTPGSTVTGTSYTCTASCNECSLAVDSCATHGCNTAGGYSCVSSCCGVYGGGGGGGGGEGCQPNGGECDDDDDCCDDLSCYGYVCTDYDPIILDLAGRGYELTSAAEGVSFDFSGTGKPIRLSWTAAGWDGGFLALDRNGNGRIDNATELFTNITPQPAVPGKTGNGFLALAVYDLPANGGNGDGWIDAQDAIFSKLLVWVDKNHNGVSDPGELLTMQQAGIQAISLKYSLNKWKDAFGNTFRYSAQSRTNTSPNQVVYDVLLQGATAAATTATAAAKQ